MKKNILLVMFTTFLLTFISVAYAAFNSELTISGSGIVEKDTIAPTCGAWYLRDSNLTIQEAYDQNKFINPGTNTTWTTTNKKLFIECSDNMPGDYGCINVTTITDNNNNPRYFKEVKEYTTSITTDPNAVTVTLKDAYENSKTCTLPVGGSNPYIDKQEPVVTITQTAANKFTYSATDDLGVTGYQVTTNSTEPTTWLTTPAEVTIDNTAAKTYYVWAKDGVNVSYQTIKTFKLTKTQGTGTTLTLKYNNNSGAALSTGYVLDGTKVYVTGSANTGYNTVVLKKDSTTISSGSTQTITAATTISSKATANTYTVNFNANGGSGTMSSQILTYNANTSLTTNTFTRSGYTFAGWNTASDGTGTNYSDGQTKPNITSTNGATVTLYAKWTANSYTVTANSNGGSIASTSGWTGTGNTSTKSVTYDAAYGTLPTVSKTGYTFQGWNGKNIFNEEEILMNITGSTYENGYYNFNPTSAHSAYINGIPSLNNFKANTQYTLTIKGYSTVTNYSHGGLAIGFKYTDGTSNQIYLRNLQGDTTEQTLTLTSTSGKNIDTVYMSYGNPCVTHIAYIQVEEGTISTTYEPYYITPETIVTTASDHTINAIWSIDDPDTPTITGGATKIYGSTATSLTCTSNTSYSSGVTKYYSFGYASSDGGTPSNWSTASTSNILVIGKDAYVGSRWYSCKVYASDGTNTSSEVASLTTADTEMTINNATITFNGGTNGVITGTTKSTNLYTKTGATTLYTTINGTTTASVPTGSRLGYSFAGWYTAASGGTKVLNANGSFTGSEVSGYTTANAWAATTNKTLYAQYTKNSYTLTFNANGGSVSTNTKSVQYGTTYNDLPTPTRTGYTFKGWYADLTGSSDYINYGREYMYEDVISIHVSAYMDNWSTFSARIFSCTEGGGWNIEPNGDYFNFAIYNKGAGYKSFASNVTKASLGSGWHDFDLVFDGQYAYGYIDGNLVGTSAVFTANGIGYQGTNSIFIGGEATSSPTTPSGGNFLGNVGNIIIKNDSNLIAGTTYNTITAPAQDLTLYARWEPNELVFNNQTITKTFSTSNQTANVTAATNGTGTYTYSKVSGESDITVSSAGVITIPASKAANTTGYTVVIRATDSNSGVTKDATYTIKVNKATNPMTFTTPQSGSVTFSTSAQNKAFTAAASAQGSVTYSITSQKQGSTAVTYFSIPTNTTASMSVAANTPAGTYTIVIKATAAGNTNYNSKELETTYTLTVNRQGIAFPTCSDKAYTASEQTLFDAHTSGSYTNNAIKGTTVGGYTGALTPTSNYQWNSGSDVTAARILTCNIVKSNTTTTANNITQTYNGNAVSGTASAKLNSNNTNISGAAFTYTYYNGSSCGGTALSSAPTSWRDEGYSYTATLTGTANYNTSTSECKTIVINKAANPMTFGSTQSGSVTFSTSAQNKAFTAAASAQGNVTYSITSQKQGSTAVTYFSIPTDSTASMRVAANTPAGTYTIVIKATAAGNTNYNSKELETTYTLTIGQAPCKLAVSNPANKNPDDTYNLSTLVTANAGTVTYALKSGGNNTTTPSTLSGSTLTIGAMSSSNDTNQSVDVQFTDPGSNDYEGCTIEKSVTVKKKTNTLAANNQTVYVSSTTALSSFIKNNNGGTVSYTKGTDNTSGSTVNSTNFVAGTLAANDDANKTVTITATSARTNKVAASGNVTITVTVQKYTRGLTLTINPTNVKYNQTATLSTSNTGSGGTPGTSVTYTSSNTNVFTVTGSTIKAVSYTGSSDITATRAGSTTVKAATATATATASQSDCLLTVSNSSMTTGSNIDLTTLTSNAVGNVTFAIKTNGTTTASTLSGSTLTAGAMSTSNDTAQTVVVTATEAATDYYTSCSKDITLTVNKQTNTLAADNKTVYVSSSTALSSLTKNNIGGSLSASITTDNTQGSSISGTNLVAGVLGVLDDSNKTVVMTVTSARTATVAQKSVTVTATVQKYTRALTITTPTANQQVEYNKTITAASTNGGSGGTPGAVTYSSSNTSVFTVDGTTIKAVGTDGQTATIGASRVSTSTVKAATATAVTVKVKKNQTCQMTVSNPASKNPGNTYDLSTLVSGATGTVTYALKSGGNNTTTASTLSGSTLTIGEMSTTDDNDQTVDVQITDSGSNRYVGCTIEKSVTVQKYTRTLSWSSDSTAANSTLTYGVTTYKAVASASGSGGTAGTISYSSNNTAVAINTSGSMSVLNGNSQAVTITASLSRTSTVKAASITRSYTTGKAVNPISVSNITVYAGSTGNDLSAKVSNAQGTVTYAKGTDGTTSSGSSVNSSTGAFTAGVLSTSNDNNASVVVTVSAAGNDNYESGSANITVTVQKYTRTLSWSSSTPAANSNLVYGTSYSATASASGSGGTAGSISYSSNNTDGATINSSSGAITVVNGNSKAVTITASLSRTSTVKAASITRAFTTKKAANPISTSNITVYAGSTGNDLSAKVSNAQGTVTYAKGTDGTTSSGSSVNSSTGAFTAGVLSTSNDNNASVTVTATAAGNDNYESGSANITVTVQKYTNTLSAKSNLAVYVSSITGIANFVQNNNGGSLSGSITTDNTAGSSISGTNFTAGVLAANDDTDKTVVMSITSARTSTVKQGSANVTVTVQKYTRALTISSPTANQQIEYNKTVTAASSSASGSGTLGSVTYASSNTSVFTVTGTTIKAVAPSGAVTITASRAGTTTVKAASATVSISAKKATCPAPTNLAISTAGVVTWTAATGASSYQISMNSTSEFTAAASGVNYNSNIVSATGSRTVYVRSVCDTSYYSSANSSNASKSTTVFSLTLNKGTGISAVTPSTTTNYITGATASINATVKTGYTWANWTGSSTISTKSTSVTVNANKTYTANATPNTYTIVFNKNNNAATGTMSDQIMTYDNETSLTPNAYVLDGYYFAGWNTQANGSGTSYADEASVSNLATSGTFNLYAQWKEKAKFDTGENVNVKMKTLAGDNSGDMRNENENIISVIRSTTEPSSSIKTNDHNVSVTNTLIYMWYDNGTIYWWSEDPHPYLNENSEGLFCYLLNVTTIDVSDFDTSLTTNMMGMFYNDASLLSIDVSNFDTSNVTGFTGMFTYMSSISSLDLSSFDMSSAESGAYILGYNNSLMTLVTPNTYPNDSEFEMELGAAFKDSNSNIYTSLYYDSPTSTTLTRVYALLDTGPSVNVKLKALAGNNNPTVNTVDTNINYIVWSESEPTSANKTSSHVISASTSAYPIYAWYDDGKIYIWSAAGSDNIYLNSNSELLYSNLSVLIGFDFSPIPSFVQDVDYMFKGCSSLITIYLVDYIWVNVTSTTDMLDGTNANFILTPFIYPSDSNVVIDLEHTYYDYYDHSIVHTSLSNGGPKVIMLHQAPTVTFDANGGSVSPSSKGVIPNEQYGELPTPTRTGYRFDGWYIDNSDYEFVEYIESTGTQYINVGIQGGRYVGFDIDFNTSSTISTSSGFGTIFGARDTYYKKGYQLTTYGDSSLKGHFLFGSSKASNVNDIRSSAGIVPNTRQQISFRSNGRKLYLPDGSTTTVIYSQSFTTPVTLTLFALNENGNIGEYSKTKLYSFKTYDDSGNVTHNFLPVINKSTGKAGLYDSVTNTFKGNSGTGDFIAGPSKYITENDIVNIGTSHTLKAHWTKYLTVTFDANSGSVSPASKLVVTGETYGELPTPTRSGYSFKGWSFIPSEYQEIEYIESTGTQWIDTGVTPNQNTLMQFKFRSIEVTGDVILGYYTGNDSTDFRFFNYASNVYFDQISNRINTSGAECSAGVDYNFEIGNYYVKDLSTNNNIVSGTRSSSFTGVSTIKLNNYNNSSYAKTRVYALKIYNGSTLIRDFVPVKKISTGKAGLYDLVSGTFYGNSGTGDFESGPSKGTVTSSTNVTEEQNHTLYAQWSAPLIVTFNANGGTVSPASKQVVQGDTYGELPLPTKSGRIFVGWKLSDEIITADTIVTTSSNHTLVAQWSDSIEFGYTGDVQTFTASSAGTYKLEVCGAQGGSPTGHGFTSTGGKGGCASGNVSLTAGQTLYIFVGGQGSYTSGVGTAAGGWNGGTSVTTSNGAAYFGTGGGATHISKSNTTIASAGNDLLIVGGGGGSGNFYYASNGSTYSVWFNGVGGNGGGSSGGSGTCTDARNGVCSGTAGTGGTQSAGGTTGGTKGVGAVGGGGGGYYGGGGARGNNSIGSGNYGAGGGGGGSGYIGGVSSGTWSSSGCANSSGLRTGNGCAKITIQ